MPKDKSLRKHHLMDAPANLVAQLEEQFQLEIAKIDDEVCKIMALALAVARSGAIFKILRFTAFGRGLTLFFFQELLQEASKESNWDLKRELSDKVAVMDAATQVALSQLLRLKMSAK